MKNAPMLSAQGREDFEHQQAHSKSTPQAGKSQSTGTLRCCSWCCIPLSTPDLEDRLCERCRSWARAGQLIAETAHLLRGSK